MMLSHKNLVLHKFLSNSQEVANAIGVDSSEMKVIAKPNTIEHALGLGWDIERNTFVFQSIAVKDGTRRGVLSTAASLFDPLGLLAPFSLKGKLLLQRLCYSKKNPSLQMRRKNGIVGRPLSPLSAPSRFPDVSWQPVSALHMRQSSIHSVTPSPVRMEPAATSD